MKMDKDAALARARDDLYNQLFGMGIGRADRRAMIATALRAYGEEVLERYAYKHPDPRVAHLHYDGCPFKPYADAADWDMPDPRPDCTCPEEHKAAYWKGQWMLERGAKTLAVRQQAEEDAQTFLSVTDSLLSALQTRTKDWDAVKIATLFADMRGSVVEAIRVRSREK